MIKSVHLPKLVAALLVAWSASSSGQDGEQVPSLRIDHGDLSVLFRDNSASPAELSGIDALFHVKQAPGFDAFDPDAKGASAGLNFEHIISGHKHPNNKFTPRHGRYDLLALPDKRSARLVRRAEASPWKVDSTLTYTITEPHYVDFEFRCTPRDAALFGDRGYAIFFFANYMDDVTDTALHFWGQASADGPEQWISADAPRGHRDWNGGGNYRSIHARDLEYDDDLQFRLNTWTYDWPRFTRPFYYGLSDHGMTMVLMFDRLRSDRDQIRFSLYKFKLPQHPRPAWDFQYVVHHVQANQQYGLRGRLVWKKFVSADDCQREYDQWAKSLQAEHVRRLRQLGATVFLRGDVVTEINANRSAITDEQLEGISSMVDMTDLSLEATHISDAGISQLSNLQRLEWLNLYQCPVGDEALGKLKQLERLQHLPIGGSRVTDAGLAHLEEMRQLKYLGLRGNQVTNEGLKHVSKLTNLTGLHLGETNVSDAGLTHLVPLQKLEQLWLNGTSVTDNSIDEIVKLKSLVELHVEETGITAVGSERLRRSLPRCRVITSP